MIDIKRDIPHKIIAIIPNFYSYFYPPNDFFIIIILQIILKNVNIAYIECSLKEKEAFASRIFALISFLEWKSSFHF